jgi:hypothetical protein
MIALKAWGMVLVAVLAYLYAALTDGGVDSQEWVVVVYTGIGAVVVYVVPNMSAGIGRYAKAVAAFATAGLAVLQVTIEGGLTTAETIEVLLAGAAAIGLVVGTENKGYVFLPKPVAPVIQ